MFNNTEKPLDTDTFAIISNSLSVSLCAALPILERKRMVDTNARINFLDQTAFQNLKIDM